MSFQVLIPQPIAREGVEELLRAGLEVVEPPSWDVQTLKSYIRDCQGVHVRTVSLSGELLKEAPGLRVISRHGVGLDNIDLQYCQEHGIQVTNLPESNTVSVAEHTIGMILSITKNFTVCDRETRRGSFDARNQYHGVELEGKTLGVVSLGRIGRLVAQKSVQGFGMRVVAFDVAWSARSHLFGAGDGARYLQRHNEESIVAIHIETAEAVENVEQLLSAPGIDIAYVGPVDLSVSMGYAAEGPGHPEVEAAADRILEVARKYGVKVGYQVGNARDAEARFDWGADYVGVAITPVLYSAFKHIVSVRA